MVFGSARDSIASESVGEDEQDEGDKKREKGERGG